MTQRCIGVDGAGHTQDGARCGQLVARGRCPACSPVHETTRTRTRRITRPYTSGERDRRAQAVRQHVAQFGWLCPGWRRAPHAVAQGYLTAEHPHAVATGGDETQPLTVLCRSCNSAKGTR